MEIGRALFFFVFMKDAYLIIFLERVDYIISVYFIRQVEFFVFVYFSLVGKCVAHCLVSFGPNLDFNILFF